MLEQLGLMLTDWGFVPHYCTDPEVLVTSVRNQDVDAQIVLVDAAIAPNNPLKLISDIRNSNITGYQFICVLKDEIDIETQKELLFAGADLVLPLHCDLGIFSGTYRGCEPNDAAPIETAIVATESLESSKP